MNEAAFSNCNAEDYINIDKDVQTEQDTMDIDALVQNFRESQKGEEEVGEEEDENDIVLDEEKCSVKTYQDAVKSLKELQEFAALLYSVTGFHWYCRFIAIRNITRVQRLITAHTACTCCLCLFQFKLTTREFSVSLLYLG
jgi:hypothetical protein